MLSSVQAWLDNQDFKVGGEGKTVSADHTFAAYNAKYNRGERTFLSKLRGDCAGIIEHHTGVSILIRVPNQTKFITRWKFFFRNSLFEF